VWQSHFSLVFQLFITLYQRINVKILEIIFQGDNMRKNIFRFSFFVLIIIAMFFLNGCGSKTTNENTKTKVAEELEYLDSQIVSLVNKLNNLSMQNYAISSEEVDLGEENSSGTSSSQSGNESSGGSGSSGGGEQKQSSSQSGAGEESQKSNITTTQMEPKTVLDSDENQIDWKSIKSQIETINEAWGVVVLDLSSLNVDNNNILGFSSALDESILSIRDENKADTLTNIANLYSYIPKFEQNISANQSTQNIKQVKSNIINAYSFLEQDDWTAIETNMAECESTFKNLLGDVEYIQDKEYKVNRTYVLIKELQNSLTYKDKELFLVKYKNLMESMNTL